MTRIRQQRSATGAMDAGLVLSVVAALVPFIDRATGNVLAEHSSPATRATRRRASTPP